MDEASADRLDRLGRAVDAFLEHRQLHGAQSDEELLERHADLRDLLEPMLATDPEGPEKGDGETPQYLGPYRIVREVGHGGMGVVYEAIEQALGRRVALKVLSPRLTSSPRAIERFRREAGAVAGMRHDAIVPIFAVGDLEGAHYFAMEFIEGRSLAAALQSGDDSLGVLPDASRSTEATEIVARIAEALDHVHRRGVVHRDVKPHNIMVAADGRVLLVDFGLAADGAHDPTGRQFAGTPYYMSPEQVQGTATVDGRADVFSLGVVLFELLTGTRPFDGSTTQQVLVAIENRAPPVAALRGARVPRDLEIICCKALEKNAVDRYATAGELAADLRRFLRHETIHAVAPTSWTRSVKFVRRNRGLVAGSTLALFLALAAAGAFWIHEEDQRKRDREHLDRQRRAVYHLLELTRESDLAVRPRQTEACRAHLESTAELCKELVDREGEDLPLAFRRRFASHMLQAGWFYMDLGEREEANACFDAATAAYKLLANEEDHWVIVANLAVIESNRSWMRGRSEDLDRYIETLRGGAEADERGKQPGIHAALAIALHARAFCSWETGHDESAAWCDLEAAAKAWGRAGENQRKTVGRGASFAGLLVTTADVAGTLGRRETALAAVTQGLEHLQLLLAREPTSRRLRSARAHLLAERAELLQRDGDSDAVEARFQDAIHARAELVRDFPEHVGDAVELSQLEELLGQRLYARRRMRQARDLWLRAFERLKGRDTRSARRLAAWLDGLVAFVNREARQPDVDEIELRFSRAVAGLERLLTDDENDPATRRILGATLSNEASWRLEEGQTKAARRLVLRAIEEQNRAIAGNPLDPMCQQFRRIHAGVLVKALEEEGEHRGMFDAAKQLVHDLPGDSQAHVNAATYACRAIDLVRPENAATSDARTTAEEDYGARAVQWLRKAVDLGTSWRDALPRTHQLRQLHVREDFQSLVEDIRRGSK